MLRASALILGTLGVLISCGGGSDKSDVATVQPATPTAPTTPSAPVYMPQEFMNLSTMNASSEEAFYTELQNLYSSKETVFYLHDSEVHAVARADKFIQEGWSFREQKPIALDQKNDWGFKPGSDRNFTFMVNSMDYVEPLFLAYIETKEQKYLDAIVKIHLDWYDYNVTQDKSNEMKWYDMSTGLRGSQLSTLLSWMLQTNYADKDALKKILDNTRLHLKNLSDPAQKGQGNHLFFQMNGIVAICSNTPEFKLCESNKKYGYDTFYDELSRQYKADGMHVEHSPGYHFYVLNILKRMLDTNWYDERIQKTIERPLSLTPWLFHPNGDMVVVGDSETNNPVLFRDLHPHMQYFLSNGRSGSKPEESSLGFMDTGYAVFRSEWDELPINEQSYLFFMASFHSSGHKHPDDFTFSWSEFGTPLIVDSGKYSYDASPLRRYAKNTRAHNTVEVSGSNYSTEDKYAYGSALKYFEDDKQKGIGMLSASMHKERFGLDFQRTLFYRKKNWVLLFDDLKASEGRAYGYKQWLHLHPEAELVAESDNRKVFYFANINKYMHIQELTTDNKRFELVKGQMEPYIQGWYSPLYKQAKANYAHSVEKIGQNATIVTLLYLSDDKEPGVQFNLSQQGSDLTACWQDASGQKDGVVYKGQSLSLCQ